MPEGRQIIGSFTVEDNLRLGAYLRSRLILLDEPSLGLSSARVTEIFALVTRLRGQGLAVLLSEQNARMSLAVANHAYVIEMGRVTLEGPGRDLLARPEIAERHLGVVPHGVGPSGTAPDDRALADGLARILAA